MQGTGLNQSKEYTHSDPGMRHKCLRVTYGQLQSICHWWDLVPRCHREEGLEAGQAMGQDERAGSERALDREREAGCSTLSTWMDAAVTMKWHISLLTFSCSDPTHQVTERHGQCYIKVEDEDFLPCVLEEQCYPFGPLFSPSIKWDS